MSYPLYESMLTDERRRTASMQEELAAEREAHEETKRELERLKKAKK